MWVPFGRRRVVGVVVERRDRTDVPAGKLRSAFAAVDEEPTFDAALLQLLLWSADYYRHPVGEVIGAAMPAPLRLGASLREETIVWSLTELGRREALTELKTRAVRLRAIVGALTNSTEMTAAISRATEARRACASSSARLRDQTKRAKQRALEPLSRIGLRDDARARRRGSRHARSSRRICCTAYRQRKTEVYLARSPPSSRAGAGARARAEIALTPQRSHVFARASTPLRAALELGDGDAAAWRSAGEAAPASSSARARPCSARSRGRA